MNAIVMEADVLVLPRQSEFATVGDLVRYAIETGMALDRLEGLMCYLGRALESDAELAFIAAMVEFKKAAPSIYKDQSGVLENGESYTHATAGGVCEAIIGLLAAQGITHNWDTAYLPDGMISVACNLVHLKGHRESTAMEAPPDSTGRMNAIQSMSSSITALQRQTLLAACGLAPKYMAMDDDGRAAGSVIAPAPTAKAEPTLTITPTSFLAAIESIRAGEYKAASMRRDYALTADQAAKLAEIEAAKAC